VLELAEVLAHGDVERVDRAVPSATDISRSSPCLDLHDRLGDGLLLAAGIEAPLDHAAVALDLGRTPAACAGCARQQLEARVRAIIGIAARLALLDDRDQPIVEPADRPFRQRDAAALQLGEKLDLPPWSDTITRSVADLSGGTCS
jgi:hypothetical protein